MRIEGGIGPLLLGIRLLTDDLKLATGPVRELQGLVRSTAEARGLSLPRNAFA